MFKTAFFDLHSIATTQEKKLMGQFSTYWNKLQTFQFTQLPYKKNYWSEKLLNNKFEHTCVVGLGGSSLGTKTLVDALGLTTISFLDNVDPDFVERTLRKLTLSKTRFIIASKSGETIEVLFLATYLLKNGVRADQCMVICDNRESTLAKWARKEKTEILVSENEAPGRFSVLSTIGLLPVWLHAPGAPEAILNGAQKTSIEDAFRCAAHQYLHYKKGKKITVMFPYCERLASFAEWYIQLLAESIGKTPEIGMTPLKALGVKDQHAQLQLFLDGPDDKFYIFVKPKVLSNSSATADLEKLFAAEYQGVIGAFKKRKKSFVTIECESLRAKSIGELLYFFELTVGFLGLLFKIDFTNQPAVELSKKITKKLL